MINNLVHLHSRLYIVCPICKRYQLMQQDRHTNVWYPIRPFCCGIMEHGDSPEWNVLIDAAIMIAKDLKKNVD